MKIFISIVALFFIANVIDAQHCTESALAQKPGSYRQSKLVAPTRGISPANLTREKAILANVHRMVSDKYVPVGVVASFGFHYDAGTTLPGTVKVADSFGYGMYLLKYNCDTTGADKSKFYVNVATPTILRIDANVIDQYRISATDVADNSFRGYLLLKQKPQKINGFYYLGNEFRGDTQSNQKNYTWLVTYDDTLPFTDVTRKEYLLLSKARLAKTIAENGNESGYYTEFVNRINDALRRPESELNQLAIVSWSDEERFTGFVDASDPYARYPVKHNPAYYRKGLPKSAPQFFTVVFAVLEGDEFPVYAANMNEVKKVVDLNFLRNMLGK